MVELIDKILKTTIINVFKDSMEGRANKHRSGMGDIKKSYETSRDGRQNI